MIYPIGRLVKTIMLSLVNLFRKTELQTAPAVTETVATPGNLSGKVREPIINWGRIHVRDRTFEPVERWWFAVYFLFPTGIPFNCLIGAFLHPLIPYDALKEFAITGWISVPISFLLAAIIPPFSPVLLSVITRLSAFILIDIFVGFMIAAIW